jgi:hypothetical protein
LRITLETPVNIFIDASFGKKYAIFLEYLRKLAQRSAIAALALSGGFKNIALIASA